VANSALTLDRAGLVQRGVRLEYWTIGYNLLEAVVSLLSGLLAGSIALIGFGLDSLIEVTSAGAILWRLGRDEDAERREHHERIALKAIGGCFFALVGWIGYDASTSLWAAEAPRESLPGIVLAAASLIVMPLLARAKRRVAAAISSGAMEADARQTDLCFYLSAILLLGLVLNAVMGWWWADPVAGLAMTPIVFKEGLQAWRGETCADCGPSCSARSGL
jgi:divalent metal cation (Fe/Co/Zn/Cd) transporter